MIAPNGRQTIFSITIAGLYILVGWNLKVSYDAVKFAQEAMLAASQARPNPYTSIDYRRDSDIHALKHISDDEKTRQLFSIQLKLLEAMMNRKIETLPRPPKHVVNDIQSMKDRLKDIEANIGHPHDS